MIRRKADQRPMTRTAWILVALLPVYVGVLTALAAMLGPGFPVAKIPALTVAALTLAALAVFAAAVFFVSGWDRTRRENAHTGVGTQRSSLNRNVTDLLAITTGAPSSQAVGYFVALIVSGGVSAGLNMAAVRYFGGTSVALQIPISILAYTLVFGIAMYVNSRGADAGDEQPDRGPG